MRTLSYRQTRWNYLATFLSVTTLPPVIPIKPSPLLLRSITSTTFGFLTLKPFPSYRRIETLAPLQSSSSSASSPQQQPTTNGTITILHRGPHHILVSKPPSVVCHHSEYTGSRAKAKHGIEPEIPMLQRLRDAIHHKVNLVHRLDRGASGALLFTYASSPPDNTTSAFISALASNSTTKTYLALVRGTSLHNSTDLRSHDWFAISRPIKDSRNILRNATTLFKFVASQDHPRSSIVLAKPLTGRWHQIRRHLNGLSHPILGDSSHGSSKTNREWRDERGMPYERLCLHLARLEMGPVPGLLPEGLDVKSPVEGDMRRLMEEWMPEALEEARVVLEEEGVVFEPEHESEVLEYNVPEKKNGDEAHILSRGRYHVVVSKPPAVVCHHSAWTSRMKEPTPMIQRVRDATFQRVNLIHRLDRSASGCLVFAFANQSTIDENDDDDNTTTTNPSAELIRAMQSPDANKTYVALVHGNGTWNGNDFLSKGWFCVRMPIKDENDIVVRDVRTRIRFVAFSNESATTTTTTRAGLILARPETGKWHQIRQHLSSGTVGHPILGDTVHGLSRTNREWIDRGMPRERTCLHLARVQLPPMRVIPEGLDVSCPLPSDMINLLKKNMPDVLSKARPILKEEGVILPD